MHADGEAFRRFVKTFGLNATDEANEIAALTGIRARGLSDPGQLEKVSVHRTGFRSLYERRQACLERNDIVMYRALGQASMDMAERILRTEYKVRGYAPSMAEKETGHRAGPPAGKRRQTDGGKQMEPLKDGYSMAWLERLIRSWKRPREEKHGNLYLELCPDNRINSFMVVRHRPQGTDPFMEFIGHTADKAIREGNGTVPDNLLLALEGVPEKCSRQGRSSRRNTRGKYGSSSPGTAG